VFDFSCLAKAGYKYEDILSERGFFASLHKFVSRRAVQCSQGERWRKDRFWLLSRYIIKTNAT